MTTDMSYPQLSVPLIHDLELTHCGLIDDPEMLDMSQSVMFAVRDQMAEFVRRTCPGPDWLLETRLEKDGVSFRIIAEWKPKA